MYPDTIEEKFYIDMDMSEYETEILCDDSIEYWVEYKKGDDILYIRQIPVAIFKQIRLNTENSISEPQQVMINNWNGVFFQTQSGVYFYAINTSEYIMLYTGNVNKEILNSLVIMTKF